MEKRPPMGPQEIHATMRATGLGHLPRHNHHVHATTWEDHPDAMAMHRPMVPASTRNRLVPARHVTDRQLPAGYALHEFVCGTMPLSQAMAQGSIDPRATKANTMRIAIAHRPLPPWGYGISGE